jgi:type 1 glutamine amidotransferase
MSEQNKYSLKLQLEAFDRNEWVDDNNHCFYFYDWFCKKTSLERKAKSLIPKVKKFVDKMFHVMPVTWTRKWEKDQNF